MAISNHPIAGMPISGDPISQYAQADLFCVSTVTALANAVYSGETTAACNCSVIAIGNIKFSAACTMICNSSLFAVGTKTSTTKTPTSNDRNNLGVTDAVITCILPLPNPDSVIMCIEIKLVFNDEVYSKIKAVRKNITASIDNMRISKRKPVNLTASKIRQVEVGETVIVGISDKEIESFDCEEETIAIDELSYIEPFISLDRIVPVVTLEEITIDG